MERPQFNAPLSAHHVAWMNGEISAYDSLRAEYTQELEYHRFHLAGCRSRRLPITTKMHQRGMVDHYLRLRRLRGMN
ncbi:hypothetical protein [Paracoccus sp. SY]|uniref:hypothetical protein n=1 Tax=Paracoccus sp. SY TaxID=1330255 RepID=UPI000CD2BFD5|nr:hypothetical protein [Paracoccus sp. SY]